MDYDVCIVIGDGFDICLYVFIVIKWVVYVSGFIGIVWEEIIFICVDVKYFFWGNVGVVGIVGVVVWVVYVCGGLVGW